MDSTIFILSAAIIGAFRGALSLVFEHPLDVIKTFWQANPSETSLTKVVRSIVHYKGVRGFYSGALPNVMRVMLKQAYRYPLMIVLPVMFGVVTSSIVSISILTGVTIAIVEVWIITPLERFKVWLMTYKHVSGGVRLFVSEVSQHIRRALYKGLKVTLVRQLVSWVTFLITHDQLMQWVKADVESVRSIPLVWLLIIGIVAGAINTAAVLPFDCVKTHQQKMMAVESGGIFNTMRYIYTVYGAKGLYAGWQARMLQYMINSAFTVAILEHLKELY
jgi:hypothetical protein